MQANILKKLKKIIISFVAVIITMQSVCSADFTDAQKQQIKDFANKVREMNTAYTQNAYNLSEALNEGYNLRETYSEYPKWSYKGTYIWLCCATWVSCILNQCFGIEMGSARNGTDAFAMPNGDVNSMFGVVDSLEEAECGDILLFGSIVIGGIEYYSHVGMYLGDGMMTDCTSDPDGNYRTYGNGSNTCGGVYVRPVYQHRLIIRYGSEATSKPGIIGNIAKTVRSIFDGLVYGKEVKFVKDDIIKIERSSKDKNFDYQGISKLESKTTKEAEKTEEAEENSGSIGSKITWFFSKLSDLFSWILNFIFTIIKGVFVGITTLIQMLITYWVDAAQGEEVSTRMSDGMMNYLGSGKFKEDAMNSISLEKIVYNQVPILDPDVFNGTKAGGKNVSSDSLVVIIRNLVAGLYTGMRQIALIGLLIALIYLGIKAATTSAGEAKGEYRKQLMNWLIAFIIIFMMHYFILGVLRINEIVVDTLHSAGANVANSGSNGEYTDMALAMRGLTYRSEVALSLLATILYMVMVYYMIKFLIMYFRRLFVIMILIILAPLLVIKNAYEQIKTGKSSDGTLMTWVREYIFSVGTQSIHAMIYTIFVSITYRMLLNSDTGKIALCIIAIMFFRFMTMAEKILRSLLKFSEGKASDIIGELGTIDARDIFGMAAAAKLLRYRHIASELTPDIVKKAYRNVKSNVKNSTRTALQNEYIRMKRDEYIRKYAKEYSPDNPTITEEEAKTKLGKIKNKIKYTIDDILTDRKVVPIDSDIDKEITEVLKQDFDYQLDSKLREMGTGVDFLKGLTNLGFGLTVLAGEDTAIGLNRIIVGGGTVKKVLGGTIKGYKSTDKVMWYRAQDGTYIKISNWSKLNGTQEIARVLKDKYVLNKDDVSAIHELKIATLHEARKTEMDLKNEINDKKDTLFKGTKPGATQIEVVLTQKYTEKLKKNVREAMKTVDRSDINREVKEYAKTNKKASLTFKDFEAISERFDVKVSGEVCTEEKNGVEVAEKIDKDVFIENVKKVTLAKMIQEVVSEDNTTRGVMLDEDTLDKMENNINNNSKTATVEEKQDMKTAIECLKEKKKEMKGQGELKVYSNLSEEEKAKINKVLEDSITEDMVEAQAPKMSTEQIVDTMKEAVNKEGSIKREKPIKEFQPIVHKVEHLRDIDEMSRQVDNKPIFEDVGTLVETMIKGVDVGTKPN